MQYERSQMSSKYSVRMFSLPSSLLSLIALLSSPMSALAQSTTTPSSLIPEPTLSTPTSLSRTESPRSMTTSFVSSSKSNSTTSSASATGTSAPPTYDGLPGVGHPDPDSNQGAFHYYWLILALFGVTVGVFLWYMNRRRNKRKEQMRLSGQNALARDMEGWVNTRRWFHGAWRPNQTHAFARREEGLNEHGEAPPPYRPKSDVEVTQGSVRDPASGVTIPLRALQRDEVGAGRPPEYQEAVGREEDGVLRSDTAISQAGRNDPPLQSSASNTISDPNTRT